jgi:Resolvase, N terminal domain/Recombinase/Recombinase zinc beta ribbon domain
MTHPTKTETDPLAGWLTSGRPARKLRPAQIVHDGRATIALYARFSKPTKGDSDSESVHTQFVNGRAWAERNYPGAEVLEYSDDGITGTSLKRPGFQRLLADIKAGKINVVAGKTQSRVARGAPWGVFRETAYAAGIDRLHTWSRGGGEVGLTPANAVAGDIQAVVDGNYVDQSRANVLDHLATHAAEGRPSGSPCTGFRCARKMIDGRSVPTLEHDERAPLVAQAAADVLAGVPVLTIAQRFTEAQVPTVRGGTQWRPSNVRRLLRSPMLAGIRIHVPRETRLELQAAGVHYFTLAVAREHGNVYRGNWDPIVDPADFLALQRVLDEPGTVRRSDGRLSPRGVKRGRARKYQLSGVMGCGRCGATVTGTKRKAGPGQYICHSSNGGCNGVGMYMERAEEAVEREFLAMLASEGFAALLAEGDPHAADRTELTAELARIDADREADAADLAAGEISRATANARAKGYDVAETAARAALAGLPEPRGETDPDAILIAWRAAGDHERRELLRLYAEVTLWPASAPERVTVQPRRL